MTETQKNNLRKLVKVVAEKGVVRTKYKIGNDRCVIGHAMEIAGVDLDCFVRRYAITQDPSGALVCRTLVNNSKIRVVMKCFPEIREKLKATFDGVDWAKLQTRNDCGGAQEVISLITSIIEENE